MVMRSSSIKRTLTLAAILILFVSASALMMRRSRASGSRALQQFICCAAAATTAPMIRVFVHADDIYPEVIRVNPGVVRLRAENETMKDIALVIERVTQGQPGQAVAIVSTVNQAKRADWPVELIAGEYTYYDEARPDIRGKLIVEGK